MVAKGEVVQTHVTNSLGGASEYTWQQPVGTETPLMLSSTGAGCVTCPATGFEYYYDESGRLVSRTHTGQGNAVGSGSILYSYDEQGRLSERRQVDANGVEHLIEQREYKDNSLLPARIMEPSVRPDELRIREFEYDDGRTDLSASPKMAGHLSFMKNRA